MTASLPGRESRYPCGRALRVSILASAVAVSAAVAVDACGGTPSAGCDAGWPDWQRFVEAFVSEDGRVIDRSTPGAWTVSEGQAYAMFFALVADDRPTFARLLAWTRDNLADGDLTRRLPAWQWGRNDDGVWGVLDANPASDADVWIAYVLDQAGRLWREPYYRTLSAVISRHILAEETADLPELGRTLLPAPYGFEPEPGVWRLNPSYLPPMLFEALASAQPEFEWPAVLASSQRVLIGGAGNGFAPDWVLYRTQGGFADDPGSAAIGSYAAIRVYLWIGMMDAAASGRAELLRHYRPMLDLIAAQGWPPETIDTASGEVSGRGPSGFAAALLPFVRASGDRASAEVLARQVKARTAEDFGGYYNAVLTLFGLGYLEGRYAFSADGALRPAWGRPC